MQYYYMYIHARFDSVYLTMHVYIRRMYYLLNKSNCTCICFLSQGFYIYSSRILIIQADAQQANLDGYYVGITVVFGYSFLVASFVLIVVAEKESKVCSLDTHTHVHASKCAHIQLTINLNVHVIICNPPGQAPTVCEWWGGDQLLAGQPHLGPAQLPTASDCLTHHHRCSSGGGVLWHCTAGSGLSTGKLPSLGAICNIQCA